MNDDMSLVRPEIGSREIADELINSSDRSDSSGVIEVTVSIREDQAFALEAIHNAELMSGGQADLSALFQQALDMFINARVKAVRLKRQN